MTAAIEMGGIKVFSHPWIRANIRPYRKYHVQIFSIVFATIVLNFIIPLTNRAVVNTGILTGDSSFVNLVIGIQAILFTLLIALNTLRSQISTHVANRLVPRMNSEYFSGMMELPLSFFQGARSGELVERMRDIERVQKFAAVELVEAVAGFVSIFSLGLLLLWVDGMVFLAFASSAAAYLVWIKLIGRQRRQVDADRFKESARSRALEIAIIESIQDIRIAGHEAASLATWSKVQIDALRTRLRSASIEQLQATGGYFFTRAGMVLVVFVCAKKAISGEITLGDFTITSVIVAQLYYHLNQLLEFSNKFDDVRNGLARALELFALEPERQLKDCRDVVPIDWQQITISEVSFNYPETERISLRGISFNVARGSMTALVGPSGSGKSTILKLLLRLYEPSSGQIQVDMANLRRIDHRHWRAQIGAVMQEGALFAATIRDNIVAGLPADDPWLEQVIEAACLEEVLSVTTFGLDTIVGPGGARLSSGQTQRILIGRALFKRPSVLLLDEATSALDSLNEASVIRNIRSLLPDATSIVAAHRLSTVMHADQVIDIDEGRIRGVGTPQAIIGSHVAPIKLSG
jgi:ATP-binding cassette, subfamily B, bacterial